MSPQTCSANPHWLSEQLPADHWEQVHGHRDYYAYLRSPGYRQLVLQPIARWINTIDGPCLDVGCGEALLAALVTVPYTGVDASSAALQRSHGGWCCRLVAGRLEDPASLPPGPYAVVVLNGVLEVLIKPEHRLELLEAYRQRTLCRYFIIGDILRLEETSLLQAYRLVERVEVFIPQQQMAGQPEVKRRRKLLWLECD